MAGAFQANAFQNNAFQVDGSPVIIVDDGHDFAAKRKRWEEEGERKRRKKHEILEAYEFLVEGKSPIVEELVAPFVEQPKPIKGRERPPVINFDKMLADADRIEALWEAYIEMDDMEVLALI